LPDLTEFCLRQQNNSCVACCCSSRLKFPLELPILENASKTPAATVQVSDLDSVLREDDRKDSSSSSSTTVAVELPKQ
jgi:hypothetical protein